MTAVQSSAAPNLLRVFLSSTFRDMGTEREVIVQRIFPALRRQCRERGLACAEIDLRWGISEEQCEQGEIVPICLREIEHSNLFVCILGDYYGTRLKDLRGAQNLAERIPWLVNHQECSVTEVEILHAVLGQTPKCSQSLFYFRTGNSPPQQDLQSARQLDGLKTRIRSAGLSVQEYSSPADLGAKLSNDLATVLDKVAPAMHRESLPERTQIAHEFFARVQSQPFVGRVPELVRLNRFFQHGGSPLLVTGSPGCGKSALIARWVTDNCTQGRCILSPPFWSSWLRPKQSVQRPCIVYFPAAEQQGYRLTELLRSVLSRLPLTVNARASSTGNEHALRRQFSHLLFTAAKPGPLVLILDGLDQLDARDLQLNLAWLPERLPKNVRLVASAAPGLVVDAWQQRKWKTWELNDFQQHDVRDLTTAYLQELYGKKLDVLVAERLVDLPHLRRPVMARVILDELRQLGSPQEVPIRLESLAGCDNLPSLYFKLIERWERSCDATFLGGPAGIVSQALALLTCSRTGLSQQECCAALGDSQPLPMAYLGALWAALDSLITNRAGVFGIASPELRQTIEQKYLSNSQRRGYHERLVELFSKSENPQRQADELPWHLAILEKWDELQNLLSDLNFLLAAWPTHSNVLAGWWSHWESKTRRSRLQTLLPKSSSLDASLSQLRILGQLLRPILSADRLTTFSRRLLPLSNKDIPDEWVDTHMFHASVLHDAEEFAEEESVCRLVSQFCEVNSDVIGRATALLQLALVARRKSNLDLARNQLEIARELFIAAGNSQGQADASGNLGLVCFESGSTKEALTHINEQQTLCAQVGDLEGLCVANANRGRILAHGRRFAAALSSQREAAKFAERLLDFSSLDEAWHHQIELLHELERYDELIDVAYNRIHFADQHKLQCAQQTSRRQLASILRNLGKRHTADSLELEATKISPDERKSN